MSCYQFPNSAGIHQKLLFVSCTTAGGFPLVDELARFAGTTHTSEELAGVFVSAMKAAADKELDKKAAHLLYTSRISEWVNALTGADSEFTLEVMKHIEKAVMRDSTERERRVISASGAFKEE